MPQNDVLLIGPRPALLAAGELVGLLDSVNRDFIILWTDRGARSFGPGELRLTRFDETHITLAARAKTHPARSWNCWLQDGLLVPLFDAAGEPAYPVRDHRPLYTEEPFRVFEPGSAPSAEKVTHSNSSARRRP